MGQQQVIEENGAPPVAEIDTGGEALEKSDDFGLAIELGQVVERIDPPRVVQLGAPVDLRRDLFQPALLRAHDPHQEEVCGLGRRPPSLATDLERLASEPLAFVEPARAPTRACPAVAATSAIAPSSSDRAPAWPGHQPAGTGTVVGLCGAASLLLQARRLRWLGTACEISLPMRALTRIGYALWLAYGLAIGDLPLILVDTAGLVGAILVVRIAVILRRRRPCPAAQ